MPECLERGTVPWLLARYRSRLFPDWLFQGWRGEGRSGRNAWPAVTLMTLLILRWSEEGISRLGSTRRAQTDIAWRAAMGLSLRAPTPSEKTVREFERFMQGYHPEYGTRRYLLFHEHVVRLCCEEGLAADAPVWAMDSTPMYCYGAVLDTVRLLGDGVGKLARAWSRESKRSLADIASEWQVPFILGKSTKGGLAIDWRDAEARASALDTVARGALQAVRAVRSELNGIRPGKRKQLLRRCRHLLRVVRDDLETDTAGRLVVAERVAKNRIISLTDPQARHGRKSRKHPFNGYKVHLLGDVVSGLITAVTVTTASTHDGAVAHRLIRRSKVLCRDIERILGDTHYGAAELVRGVRRDMGVTLLAPPIVHRTTPFGRDSFHIDFDAKTSTCPEGVTTTSHRTYRPKGHGSLRSIFRWSSEDCNRCPSRPSCCGRRKGGKSLQLHPFEPELRRIRALWNEPQTRQEYRTRSQCERLVNQVVRHGGRQARQWGLQAANLQAHTIAITCNLRLLARTLAENI